MTELPMPGDAAGGPLEDKLALCLSGGGYRAMVFHAGVLWYLNDAGFLPTLDRVSSVSGGSITAGVIGIKWAELEKTFDAKGRSAQFGNLVVAPIRAMASTTIDAGAVITGALLPGVTIGDKIIRAYRRVLFGETTLQNLPDRPKFILSATNVQTGALFRFSKEYLADWRVGQVLNPTVAMAAAVAASSAFPPILSPSTLELKHSDWTKLNAKECGVTPFTTKLVLTDAGVYDNLGIEPVWKRCSKVLVSDAGGRYQPEPDPHRDPVRHALRVQATTDNQVRSLRKRQVVGSFVDKTDDHDGAYFGMWVDPDKYPTHAPKLVITAKAADELARTPTRLAKMPTELQNRLINFGYGMAERAIRSYFDPTAFEPQAFPCPGGV
jgi:NTE family protein